MEGLEVLSRVREVQQRDPEEPVVSVRDHGVRLSAVGDLEVRRPAGSEPLADVRQEALERDDVLGHVVGDDEVERAAEPGARVRGVALHQMRVDALLAEVDQRELEVAPVDFDAGDARAPFRERDEEAAVCTADVEDARPAPPESRRPRGANGAALRMRSAERRPRSFAVTAYSK
jgi:hypothetical protein